MKKVKKSEKEIVHDYATKIIHGKVCRGHVDKRFGFTDTPTTNNKSLWMDTDFFFSVVFQSQKQKMEFLEKVKWITDIGDGEIQIVNGLKLAESLGINLSREKSQEPPYGNLDLRPFVLDSE